MDYLGMGNTFADAMAQKGAALHRVPEPIRTEAARRADASKRVAAWLGRGLEEAAKFGALPPPVAQGTQSVPRVSKRLVVMCDDSWSELQKARRRTMRLHSSHTFWAVGDLVFCAKCGGFSADRLQLLKGNCRDSMQTKHRYRLQRLRDGKHPVTEEELGTPWRLSDEGLQAARLALLEAPVLSADTAATDLR